MFDLIKIAFRNVGRNKRRTLITVLTVFIGVVVCISTRGLLNGLQGEIRSNLTRKMHGDLQIHKHGYQDSIESNPFKLLIPEKAELTNVEQAPRVRVLGLLNHQASQTTTPVMIVGIDSLKESIVCPRFAKAVQQGEMLDSSKEIIPGLVVDDELTEAKGLDDNSTTQDIRKDPRAKGFHQIMVTPSLMRGLNAKIGDELVVLLADKDNMQQAIVANLVGVIDLGMPGAAPRMAWMDLTSLQKTLNIQALASEIALKIPEGIPTDFMRDEFAREIPKDQVIETWLELGGFLKDAMALQDIVFSGIVVIMFLIVIAAIINTSLMTVMERTREIGTLMALGYRRKHILLLFLTEAGVIGGLGGLSGLLAGVAIVNFLNYRGLVMTLPGQSVQTLLYPNVPITFLFLTLVLSIVAALISGLVPAYRASRLKPVQALSST